MRTVIVLLCFLFAASCKKAKYAAMPMGCRESGVLASIEYRQGQRDIFATFKTTDGRVVAGKWWVDNAVPPVGSRICWAITTGTIHVLRPLPPEPAR